MNVRILVPVSLLPWREGISPLGKRVMGACRNVLKGRASFS